eukprot:gb/GECH01011890.1/.p1 GENE.gb/GECH01011890.1/~~gb/GECH01011890.1/.p1  ORF type:complete len:441 (+),score=105.15 gb/GECH01011890.1/:1-1323(+)
MRRPKPEELKPKVDEAITKAQTLASSGKIKEAVEELLVLEKQTRLAEDADGTAKLVTEIIDTCGNNKAWNELNQYIVLLSKRRAQLKHAITKMVQRAMEFITDSLEKKTKAPLIETLRSVTEGKIYVELERARLTRKLAAIKEEDNDLEGAAKVLEDVQVETVGSMEIEEKIDYLLEQLRITLDTGDFVRAKIVSRKVSQRALANLDKDRQQLKIRYHELMLRIFSHSESYLDMFRAHQAIYNTPILEDEPKRKQQELCNMVIYLVLAPFDNEQHDFMHRVLELKDLEEVPVYKSLLRSFVSTEIIFWNTFSEQFSEIKDHEAFSSMEHGENRWEHLHRRAIEHNLRTVAKFYDRISIERLNKLLDLSSEKTEQFISDMVTSNTVWAKIDRLDGIVNFSAPSKNSDVLNSWSSSVSDVLDLVEKSCHLINREQMVHRVKS